MTTIKGIVALALALSAALACAETVYKYQRPDGTIVYSGTPIRGARLIGKFDLVPAPPPQGGARGDRSQQSKDLASKRAEQRARALDAADAEIKAADQALKDALERQQRAIEPLPGERLANVGGHTRLGPAYFERQRAVAAEVDAARARLDRAYRLRNELRE
jgi:hypothetical protein